MPQSTASHSGFKLKFSSKLLLSFILIGVVPLLITNIILMSIQSLYWQVGGEYKLSGSQSFFLALMLFLVLSILLALISWLLTQYLINPIIQLRTGTRLFASGNFNYRIPIKTKDEVGEAANDLNLMANNISLILNKFIQEKNVSIQERNKAAIALSTIADAVIAVDLNRNITIFNNAASDLTGYGEAQVLGKPISQVIKVFENKDELSPVIYG